MIHLSPEYRIDCSDKLNATLQTLKVKSKDSKYAGAEYWDDVSYHRDIPGAVKHWARLQTFEADNFIDLLKIIKELDQKIDDLMSAKEYIV